MIDYPGYFFLFSSFILFYIWLINRHKLRSLILTAFLLRAFFLLLDNHNVITLPDSQQDAVGFDLKAREFSNNYGLLIIFDYFKNDSLLISRIISTFYTIFGESKMMAQSISVLLGTISVYFVYYLSKLLWNHNSAIKAAWISAIFPTLILYSTLILREIYIIFFLLLGLIGLVKFLKNNSLVSLFLCLISFFILNFLHGPMMIGGFVALFYLFLISTLKQLKKLDNLKISLNYFIISVIFIFISINLLNNSFFIPYIGSIESLFSFERLQYKSNVVITGDTAFPSYLIINNKIDLIKTFFIRIFYFLYSPFIWNLKFINHALGSIDGILVFTLSICLYKNWSNIVANQDTLIIVLILLIYIVIYSYGTGNSGTAIRHRSSLVILFLILSAPKLKKIVLLNNKKK